METTNYRKLLIVSAILHVLIQVFISNGFVLVFTSLSVAEFGTNPYMDKFALRSLWEISGLSGVIISYVALYFILKARNYDVRLPVFHKITASDCLCIILVIIGLAQLEKPIIDYKILANTYLNTSFELPVYGKKEFLFSDIYKFISVLFLAPICEELLFRQHILRGLQQENGQKVAIFVSSLLFGLIHFDSIPHIINTFIFGIVTAIFILKSKNFYHAILLHFIFNLLYVLHVIFIDQYREFKTWLGVGLLYWVMVGLGLLFVIIGFSRQKKGKDFA